MGGGLLAGNGAGGASPQPPQQGLEPPTADTVGGGTRVGSEVGSAAGSAAASSAFGPSDERGLLQLCARCRFTLACDPM